MTHHIKRRSKTRAKRRRVAIKTAICVHKNPYLVGILTSLAGVAARAVWGWLWEFVRGFFR
jgi:hypothetical protein